MKQPPVISSARPRARRLWLWGALAALVLLPFVVLAAGVASYFHLSSDTKALRNSLMRSASVQWRPQIVLNVGNGTLSAVRAGLSFVELDAEARAALRAIRGAEVGIYQLASGEKSPDRAAMLAAADAAMNARGWDRVVGVLDGQDLVAPADEVLRDGVRRTGDGLGIGSSQPRAAPAMCARPPRRARQRTVAGETLTGSCGLAPPRCDEDIAPCRRGRACRPRPTGADLRTPGTASLPRPFSASRWYSRAWLRLFRFSASAAVHEPHHPFATRG